MAYEIPEGKGTLFPNDFKVSDTHPDYRGTMKWKGEVIAISVWKGETQSGAEKLSIKLSEPRQKGGDGSFNKPDNTPKPPQRKFAPVPDDDGDSIPF